MNRLDKKKEWLYNIAPFVSIALFIVFWHYAIIWFNVPKYVLVGPDKVVKAWIKKAPEIMQAVGVTVREIIFGYLIGVSCGILLALIFTSNEFLNNAVSPYIVFLICTPQMVLIPLLMMKLGFDISLKVAAVAISTFPINMMSTQTGVRSVSIERYELMQSLRASKLQTFFQVLVPSALPNVFTGMRLATIFATTSAVGGELLCSTAGIGKWVSYYSNFLRMDNCLAYIITMVIISVGFYLLINALEMIVVKRFK